MAAATLATISSDAAAMTKLRSVSSVAMVDTDEGKNCGVSTATTKPWFAARMIGLAGLSDRATMVSPCSRAMRTASTVSDR